MQPIKSTAKYLMVLLGCIHMTCGPQGALQAVAWISMLANYSLENGVAQGVVDTFGGERPCAMCNKLADTDFGEGSSEAPAPERRNHSPGLPQEWQPARATCLSPPSAWLARGQSTRPPPHIGSVSRESGAPDTPPPRLA